MIIAIYRFRERVDKETIRVLLSFPVLITILILSQQIYPTIILSGTAVTTAILIIYLYFQRREQMTDDLTHLFNRRTFVQDIQKYIAEGVNFYVVHLNIIDFKTINDRFGEKNGDQILRGVANYLKSINVLFKVYRTGGDDFAVICRNLNEAKVQIFANEIYHRFEKPWTNNLLPSTVLVGIAVLNYPNHVKAWEDMIELIEYCSQQANQQSGSRIYYADETSNEVIVKKRLITKLIKVAIEENLFYVVYQPIYEVSSKRFKQCEALLRLEDPQHGIVYPNDFIAIAEETGLIFELTKIVVEKVCRFIDEADQAGVELESVAINLSSTQLSQESLIEDILEIMLHHRVNPNRIVFEITEAAFISNSGRTLNFMKQLNHFGVKFSLDDFGTGFSNLSTMMGLPFNTIKIDKSMLGNAIKSEKNSKILEGICHAFSEVGFNIVVEGVEDSLGHEITQRTTATHIQGFYFAKPMRSPQLLNLLSLKDLNLP